MGNKLVGELKNEKGFTLIELITVIVVLGIILGIGVPKYSMMQAQAEWDADAATLQNFARMAEILYANDPSVGAPEPKEEGVVYVYVQAKPLHQAGLFDGGTVLNRIREGLLEGDGDKYKSIRNIEKLPIYDEDQESPVYHVGVQINTETGKVRWDVWYDWWIGRRPGS